MAGPGVAIAGEDLLDLALERAMSRRSVLVPVEAVAVASFAMMERDGIVTIPVAGMLGAASVFRLMMFPDGGRLGDERLLASVRHAIETLAAIVGDAKRARAMLMGRA
jgi:L-seryl-tRNA(Ser) seleniumtransferase